MMYVLDTNVLSELRKVRLGKADGNVTAWSDSIDAAAFWGNYRRMGHPWRFVR